jgi:ketosteroid isomerase-like protein
MLEPVDEAVEWWEPEELPYGGTRHGREQVMRFFSEDFPPHYEEFRGEPEEFIDGGDQIVVLGHYHGRARDGGDLGDPHFVHVWDFQDGRVVRYRDFTDKAAKLAAASTAT